METHSTARLTVGSLFSGIGGIDIGLERAGMSVVWMCENNAYARKVLHKNWPDVPVYDDVRLIDETAPKVDVLCGGFPCQDVSFAGKREGLNDGTRTGLWIEFARIIRILRPRYVLLENVPGLLSLGFGRVLGALAEIGYDAEWQVLSAAQFGAWHLRRRVFIVAYPYRPTISGLAEFGTISLRGREDEHCSQKASGLPKPNQFETNRTELWQTNATPNNCERNPTGLNIKGSDRSDPDRERCVVPELFKRDSAEQFRKRLESHQSIDGDCEERTSYGWQVEPAVGRLVDGFPGQLDQLRCLGNAVVPQIAEYLGELIIQHNNNTEAR